MVQPGEPLPVLRQFARNPLSQAWRNYAVNGRVERLEQQWEVATRVARAAEEEARTRGVDVWTSSFSLAGAEE